jgi:hypothetical protein
MTFLNVCKRWARVGAMPLFQTLLVDGAMVYIVLILTFGLDIFANVNSKVGVFHPILSTVPLLMRHSFIIPFLTPSAWQCFMVTAYPKHASSFAMSLGVITCNHLILSLREARDRPISTMAPLSTFSRHTTNKAFAPQASNITHTYTNQSKIISLEQRDISTDWDLQQENLAPERGLWHERLPSGGSTPHRDLEMD